MKKARRAIELDGRTGEGGGQLVRIACGLSALTSQPIRIHHVRGNREGARGGGLKAQHLSAIEWLASATQAQTEGVSIRSKSFELRPSLPPTSLTQRNIKIVADTPAASTLLIFQAIFPFLLFAGTEDDEPIILEIHGGTNVSWSLSYEYLDQVLLPTLKEQFDIDVERRLLIRGWAQGSQRRGTVWFKIKPIRPGQTLKPRLHGEPTNQSPKPGETPRLDRIDVSLIVPSNMQSALQNAISSDLEDLFPDTSVHFIVSEDSGHESRIYILLVAHSTPLTINGSAATVEEPLTYYRRWGRDFGGYGQEFLYDKRTRKKMSREQLCHGISRTVCKDLYTELSKGGVVDEYLQDQLVVFQALADGRTSFPRDEEGESGRRIDDDMVQSLGKLSLSGDAPAVVASSDGPRLRKDKTHEPFGQGSTHTTTARWVVSELIPQAVWFNRASICDGGAVSINGPGSDE
ncbi:RNA 3'-terminal phosphate cyclase-domain-containing protein [Microdochium trichocladiopsis]|uniref:RNA 3'-terminal phosphate cyclase-domain-containing protein n=1 Tax=Microdochium trichocladiopsis TaxID=1682393 RepID=A0A9P8YEN0_9PEZI|nr:RNA 3'-terminal phosphate cyclase-domain-containing protein [Microdochium trichocladiopsis]KAH7037507.1 RNA 3'-terminal phosphate cyclase-domain-containing protein [Microdochium trichocladiopsis]